MTEDQIDAGIERRMRDDLLVIGDDRGMKWTPQCSDRAT
jgi:hypothetical protein